MLDGKRGTMPQIMARSRHIILKHKSKWNEQQSVRAKILFEKFSDLEKAYTLCLDMTNIFNKKPTPAVARLNPTRWYDDVGKFDNREFNKVLETLKSQYNHNQLLRAEIDKRIRGVFQRRDKGVSDAVSWRRRHQILHVPPIHALQLTGSFNRGLPTAPVR